MNIDMRISKVEQILEEEIQIFLSEGGELVAHTFGGGAVSCPINLIRRKLGKGLDYYVSVEKMPDLFFEKYQITFLTKEIWAFIDGFDGSFSNEEEKKFFLLGQKLRQKYILTSCSSLTS